APEGDLWHYNLHKMDDFLARIATPGYPTVAAVMTDIRTTPAGRKQVEAIGVSYYDESIPKTQVEKPKESPAKPASPAQPAKPAATAADKGNGPLAARL
ncbi:MAG TPA: hypothetical protein PK493_16435, partial [Pseudomonadota bacterium]|nr:hypothetical protein [Pseudomonadota bacterium]